jgi:Rne/Rng family ribonuclease
MSKELVISAASHERRVAILEEGQLVEIYIEREKEFALVGSIYKGRVTRVLPGMQSAFVDIGLDGDAFLYVSDVFENLEDYDHGHGQGDSHSHGPAQVSAPVAAEVLPGETVGQGRAPEAHEGEEHHDEHEHSETHAETGDEAHSEQHEHHDDEHHDDHEHDNFGNVVTPGNEIRTEGRHPDGDLEPHNEFEERQPESNASAPQNFAPHYNPTQKYPQRNDRGPRDNRGGQNYSRPEGDRGNDRGGDRGPDRGGGRGRFGRRGGRRRGGRSGPSGPGGRNLPPSKYAAPQGGDQRGNDSRGNFDRGGRGNQGNRGYDNRGDRGGQGRYDNRRSEGSSRPPSSQESGSEEEILLPGESLAKYRARPAAAAPSAPVIEHESHDEPQPNVDEPISRGTTSQSSNAPRRSSGLPSWLLAGSGAEAEVDAESAEASVESPISTTPNREAAHELEHGDAHEDVTPESTLSEEEVAALSSSIIEAKQDEVQAHAPADAIVGGAAFDDDEEEDEEESDEVSVTDEVEASDDTSEENETVDEIRTLSPLERAEIEAEAAHEEAVHAAETGAHAHEEGHDEHEQERGDAIYHHEGELQNESLAASGESAGHAQEDDSILLPGETRSPRVAGAPRDEFAPRDSARIGSGNPRSRFQRPFRSGSGGRDRGGDRGGDRGRDNRGGRDRGRGGRPGGRFQRRGPGGPRHDRGYQGGRSGPPRRPQLISEMLKAGQDVVIQIAKEPLGKKGARITSHVALPGRFLVYMPTVHHTGVSRKIISAENRSRLRRLVSEAGNAYPGGFIVRTAAGDATDDEIRADIDFLGKTWLDIKTKSEERKAPALLHRDLDLVERMLRDYVSDDFTAIWIDNEEEYGKVVEFVSRFQPKLVNRVKLYTKETPIFEEFGIQHELDKALRAKVWLKSGGYIVINHTEALVAIDVNTGKFVGKGSTRLEDTIVKTNLEAVKEIVRQIRLRDLGGIIVVDFIDMEERRNREKVLSALQQALEQDKAPSKALSFNEFGLVCITRKRTKQALERVLCQPCPYCTGSGMVKSSPTLCYEIQAEARKMAAADHENPNLTLRVHPEIAKALKTRESMLIDELEQTTHKHVIIQSDATLHWEQYDIY